ncbi:UNVERIFIED_CONTAM: hypothetical protein FKN15_031618 [Acipenser sinensis]
MSTASKQGSFYTELSFLKVSPDRMQACELAALILLTVVSCSRQYDELPQTTFTLEPPFPEIFTGETVTLRCGVEGGSAGWKYLWYKDSEDTPVLKTAGHSMTGDSFTITAAAVSDQDQYCCRGQREDQPLYSQLSNPVTLTVSDKRVSLQIPPQPVFEGDTLTLRCLIRDGYKATRVIYYKDNKELQSQADTELSVDHVSKSDEGSYKCRAWWRYSPYSGDSAEVSLSVMSHRYIHTGVYSSCVNVTLQRCGCQ